jgi:Zn-dependent peptidase ImmA (M78 family)
LVVEQNISRLYYLLKLYNIREWELLNLISEGLKNPLQHEDIFTTSIQINYLKRIDKIFEKGLSYYLNPNDPIERKDASIFFRKQTFNSELNLAARKKVSEFEDLKLSLSAIARLSNIEIKRTLSVLTPENNPRSAARGFRKIIYPSFNANQREFLKSLINELAAKDVYVFEFIETWNQKDRANIDGFFLNPNVIVLKRQAHSSYRREIFTLMHEVGHYLLDIEEVERVDYDVLAKKDNSKVEQWCNDFAFYFLLGHYDKTFDNLPFASSRNDYHNQIISDISKNTHLSKLALFTRLLFENKIDYPIYQTIRLNFESKAKAKQEELERQRELAKAMGIQQGGGSKPINSNLLISTIQTAFYEGVIDEYKVCKTLKISPDKLSIYIQ